MSSSMKMKKKKRKRNKNEKEKHETRKIRYFVHRFRSSEFVNLNTVFRHMMQVQRLVPVQIGNEPKFDGISSK